MNQGTIIVKDISFKHRKSHHKPVVAACILLFFLVACGEPPPTLNPVQTIAPEPLTQLVTSKNFTGFLVAFAAWCPPCREELPDLAKLYREYQERGIQIVGMSLDGEGPAAVQLLVNRLNLTFPVYWVGTRAMAAYGLIGIPTLIVIKEGKVIEKRPGRQSHRELERKIKALIEAG